MSPARAGDDRSESKRQKRYDTAAPKAAVTRFACSQAHLPSLRRRCDTRPFLHLHSGDELVGTLLGAEQRGLALFDIEPLLPERVDNVWLMRNENRVGARRRCSREQLAKCVAAAAVLVRRYHETALSKICGFLDILETRDDRSLVGPVVLACKHLADRNPCLKKRIAKGLCQCFAVVI